MRVKVDGNEVERIIIRFNFRLLYHRRLAIYLRFLIVNLCAPRRFLSKDLHPNRRYEEGRYCYWCRSFRSLSSLFVGGWAVKVVGPFEGISIDEPPGVAITVKLYVSLPNGSPFDTDKVGTETRLDTIVEVKFGQSVRPYEATYFGNAFSAIQEYIW